MATQTIITNPARHIYLFLEKMKQWEQNLLTPKSTLYDQQEVQDRLKKFIEAAASRPMGDGTISPDPLDDKFDLNSFRLDWRKPFVFQGLMLWNPCLFQQFLDGRPNQVYRFYPHEKKLPQLKPSLLISWDAMKQIRHLVFQVQYDIGGHTSDIQALWAFLMHKNLNFIYDNRKFLDL